MFLTWAFLAWAFPVFAVLALVIWAFALIAKVVVLQSQAPRSRAQGQRQPGACARELPGVASAPVGFRYTQDAEDLAELRFEGFPNSMNIIRIDIHISLSDPFTCTRILP
jgi:hypothetical protein